MKRLLVCTWLIASFGACSENGIAAGLRPPAGLLPDIVVEPTALAFGTIASDQELRESFTIRNDGDAFLNVVDISIDAGFAFELTDDATAFELAPGEHKQIPVVFSPVGTLENYGRITVHSDDWYTPTVPVDLIGGGATPWLEIEPDNFIFGEDVVPCGSSVEVTLTNTGSEDLVISGLDYQSAGLLTLDDSGLGVLPLTLAPNETRAVTVDFLPIARGDDTGRLDVASNDPRGVVSAYQNGEGFSGDTAQDVFTEPDVAAVDVLMLIDHSCSMETDNIDDVTLGIPLFMDALDSASDWQLMLVTEDDACTNTGIITASTKDAAQLMIDHAWDGMEVGRTEALLDLASSALDESEPGGCNEGFLREGALLHVVTISDEREQSFRPFTHWLDEYAVHAGSPSFVTVSAVADIHYACGDGSGPGGYLDAAEATGGSVLDICDPSWGSEFGDVATEILAGVRTYNLDRQAVPGSLTVYVNDVETSDFTYGIVTNSVTVHSPAVGEGDMVRVAYFVGEDCPVGI